ncbi:DASH complex subunit ask1 [Onygenales sp. PD_40]|nr:DASH complex subunit ask1 [Onygenales sp. PD_40]KAK2788612.1 DASH complex subunit ask1 [Onygenales sp. PD_12]KAK2795072.1 DASH complex subunit ask1 [Onygenales sp. PD_10]
MSRPNPAQRNLTLMEELERLEQSITLTLQEIDHNFSRAHRIVTTSILPLVEQYAEHSREVWEGSKFWKEFFESSANVALSGYDDAPPSETEQEPTYNDDTTYTTHTTTDDEPDSCATPSSESIDIHHHDDAPDLSSLTITPSHSTPRPKAYTKQHPNDDITSSSIDYPTPYETQYDAPDDTPSHSRYMDPVTPGRNQRSHPRNIATTPTSSPFAPSPSHARPSTAKKGGKPTDPILHRVLDKTYRVQATPLASSRKPTRTLTTPKSKPKPAYLDSSPLSSPEIEVPKLHSEIFSSPIKGGDESARRPRRLSKSASKNRAPPRPGISVLTPAKGKSKLTAPKSKPGVWDSDDDLGIDDDDDDDVTALYGHSPPKTMQFHVPQTRLLKTPAKEASKRIVSELLYTAGGGEDLTDDEFEHSPSIVRRAAGLEDESF